MKAPVGGGGGSSVAGVGGSPLAIVALVLVLGAAVYLWRMRYLRSRAALIVLAAVVAVLAYIGFFTSQPLA